MTPVFALNFVPAGRPAAVTPFVVAAITTFTLITLPDMEATAAGAANGFAADGPGVNAVVEEVASVVATTAGVEPMGAEVDVVVPVSVAATVELVEDVSLDDGAETLVSGEAGDDEDGVSEVEGASVDVATDAVVKLNAEVCLTTAGHPTDQHATSRK